MFTEYLSALWRVSIFSSFRNKKREKQFTDDCQNHHHQSRTQIWKRRKKRKRKVLLNFDYNEPSRPAAALHRWLFIQRPISLTLFSRFRRPPLPPSLHRHASSSRHINQPPLRLTDLAVPAGAKMADWLVRWDCACLCAQTHKHTQNKMAGVRAAPLMHVLSRVQFTSCETPEAGSPQQQKHTD